MLKTYRPPSTLIECNAAITNVSIVDIAKEHCVYEIWKDETLIYLGCCHVRQVLSMPDAKTIARFVKLVGVDDKIGIVIKYIGDRIQCYNKRGQMLRQVMPECNKYVMIRAKLNILCNEDGKMYRTQTEVCNVYGIKQSNLSAHLAGKPGFNTLQGRSFSRVSDDDA